MAKPNMANTTNELLVRPVSWASVNPSAAALQANPSLFPSIQIFGYTSDGRTIYVRIPRKSTFILKFVQDVDDDMVENITDILNPSSIEPSTVDSKVLIVRAPELSPIELTANPDFEGLATWTEARQDPYGEIESLWEARQLGPYDWLSITRYAPLPGKYTNSDLNIRTDEDYIFGNIEDEDLPKIVPRLFFWDIETFSSKQGEFPSASNPNDYIALISIITVSQEGTNGYVIVRGNVIPEVKDNMIVIKANDERDLLNKFFALYNTFKPDRYVYYNGDLFDMPYLLDRVAMLDFEIPRVSKIPSLKPYSIRRSYPTPFGNEFAKSLVLPGTESIDLINYYRRFYPYLNGHRLDNVAKTILGEGKTGLTIDDMMEALRLDDPVKLADVVNYSFTDSLRMFELWEQGNIQEIIEVICDNLGISTDTLLRLDFTDIVDRAVYNIDPGTIMIQGKGETPKHIKEAVPGIYRNVYTYDYSELYREIMLTSNQPIVVELAKRLEDAPPKLIMTAFYSAYVNRTELLPLLSGMLDGVLSTNTIIALEPFIIRSVGKINTGISSGASGKIKSTWLKEIDRSPCYVSVSKASYLILNDDGELQSAGLSKLCRPKFGLAADIIKQYVSLVYTGDIKGFFIPDLKTEPLEQFILTDKLSTQTTASKPDKINQDTMTPAAIKKALILQYGAPITTWASVKYIITTRGPVLVSALKPDDTIDYDYYMAELNKYIRDLQTLKVYGV